MKSRPSGFLILVIFFVTVICLLINIPDKVTIQGREVVLVNMNTLLSPLGLSQNVNFRKGLDLEGGTSITLQADMKDVPSSSRKDALESAKEVIERRINYFGVSEPVIQTSLANNNYRIIVEIPGITDVNQAVALVGKTAQLSFWESGEATGSAQQASASALPLGVAEVLGSAAKKTELVGSDLKKAAVTFNPNTGEPQVNLTFTGEGTRKFAAITKRNVGKIVGIVLDDVLIQKPVVNVPILTGDALITGGFNVEQAKALQIQLNAGALPVSLEVLQQRAIGASLGDQTLQKSVIAGLIGFFAITIFMIGLYGRLGVIASLALVVYTLINLAIYRLVPITLTLAGIAGFILSIGIAVDANILIFERIREEVRKGKSIHASIDIGFSRAWASIRDSNIASLITSAILMIMATGIVRGFALTLAIGVLVSLFSAVVVTKTLLRIVYR